MIKTIFSSSSAKVGAIYGSSSILSSIVTMLTGILMIRWIEPGQLGIWQSLSIIQLYVPFFELGVPHGLNRELPYLYGKGEENKAVGLAQTAQAFMIWISLLFLLLTIMIGGVLYFYHTEPMLIAGIITVGLMVSVNAYQRYLTVTFRSSESFLVLSKVFLYKSIIQVVFFPIVYFLTYYGLLIYSLFIPVASVILMHLNRPIRQKPAFQLNILKLLIKTGVPVFIMNYLRGISTTFTRIILLAKGGTNAVGLFTPASAVDSLISILPGILGNFFFPKMNYQLGKTENPKLLWPLVLKINGIIFLVGIPFVIIVWISTPYLMNLFFVKYVESIEAIQLFSLNFLVAGTLTSHNVIYAVKKYKLGYLFLAFEFLLKFILPYIFVNYLVGNILTLTSMAILIANIFLFVLNLFIIRYALFNNTKDLV